MAGVERGLPLGCEMRSRRTEPCLSRPFDYSTFSAVLNYRCTFSNKIKIDIKKENTGLSLGNGLYIMGL